MNSDDKFGVDTTDALTIVVGGAVTLVWVISTIGDVAMPSYHVPAATHWLMAGVVGGLFGFRELRGRR